tara:strand:- start:99 stop:1223 length:1125 start_codon:yes stop_codon:yes gene_type:complete
MPKLNRKIYWSGNRVKLIEHRGKPHIIWYDGYRAVLRVAKGETLAEQKAFAQTIEEEMAAGNFVRDSRTFAKMCELFLEESREQVNRDRKGLSGRKISRGRYVELAGHINNHLMRVTLPEGNLRHIIMKDIDAAIVVQVRADLARRLKGQTANKVLNTLNRVCVFAIERGDMKSNPVRDVDPLPNEPKREDYTPSPSEVAKVVECASERYKPIIKIAAMTGLRVGELTALEWGDIEDGVLTVQRAAFRGAVKSTKTSNGLRKLRLSAEAQQTFEEWRPQAPKSVYVFPATTGRMDSHDNWRNRGLHPACVKAGVPKFGWHGLRRFYINSLLDAGAPEDYVQKLVGHAVGSNVTAAHYRRIRDENVLTDTLTVSI